MANVVHGVFYDTDHDNLKKSIFVSPVPLERMLPYGVFSEDQIIHGFARLIDRSIIIVRPK